MKRGLMLCLIFFLFLNLCSCQTSHVPGLDWDAEEMVELHVFQGGVPADAHRKITTDPEEIQRVAKSLFALKVERDAVNEDVPCGGIGTYLSFYRADTSRETVLVGSGGDLLYTGEGFYKLKREISPNQDVLWDSIDAQPELVGENQLPEIGSFPPPEAGNP